MQMPTLKNLRSLIDNLVLQSSSTVGKSEEIFSQLIKKSSSLQISKKRRWWVDIITIPTIAYNIVNEAIFYFVTIEVRMQINIFVR